MLVSSTRRAYRHTLSGLLEQVISGISAISLAVYAYNVSWSTVFYNVSLHLNFTVYVSETGGEGGDHVDGVSQHEQVPEFPVSTSDSKAHPGVLQYRTGNYYWANF